MGSTNKTQNTKEEVARRMVADATNNVYNGSPRETMEEIDVSSGPLYKYLYDLGMQRQGRGNKARWIIPKSIINKFTKKYKK